MKPSIKWIIVITVGVYLTGCNKNCTLETEKVETAVAPLVETLANYAQSNGIPKSLADLKNLPYSLEPCTKKPDLTICKEFEEEYVFEKDHEYYSVGIGWIPTQTSPNGFSLNVTHHTTYCSYEIFYNGRLEPNYSKPTCSLIGSCKGWGKQ